MGIIKHTILTFHYTLKNDKGVLLESTRGGAPVETICGSNMFLPKLEKTLRKFRIGDKKTIIITPSEAYGYKKNDLALKISRSNLPEGEIKIGHELRRVDENGKVESFRVTGFLGDWVFLDGNHPWAGMELHYEVEILNIRHTGVVKT